MALFKEKICSFINKYLIYIIFACALLSLIPNFEALKVITANRTGGIIYRGIVLGLISILFVLALISFKKLPNKLVLIACGIYLITNILAIFLTPSILGKDVSIKTQFIGIAVIIGNIMTIFISFFLLNSYQIEKSQLNLMTYILIGFTLFLCLYTYIFQYKDIINTFTKEYGWNYDVKSIFQVKTEYGFCLMITSIYVVIYAITNKKYWFYIFPVFFLANALISRSKTSVLCILLLLIGVLIYHIITSWQNNKKKWIIAFSIAIPLLLVFAFLVIFKVGPFAILNKFISEVIIGDGITVTQDRLTKWGKVFKTIKNPFNIIFGCGERIAPTMLIPRANIGDNIYVSSYGTGGIIKLGLYLSLIIYLFYRYIKNDNPKSVKFIQCFILPVYLVAGLFEDDSLIGLNATCLFSMIAIYSSNSIFKSCRAD